MANLKARLLGIQNRQDKRVDSIVGVYERRLEAITRRAEARTLSIVQSRLSVDSSGIVTAIEGNRNVLRGLQDIYMREIKRVGFDIVNEWFRRQFPGGLQFLDETIKVVNEMAGVDVLSFDLGARDKQVLANVPTASVEQVSDAVNLIAGQARNRAMLNVGSTSVVDLTEIISNALGSSKPQAVGLAETSLSTFYRTATDMSYKKAESTGRELLYEPYGPLDKLTRRFCRRLLESKRLYTRAEIDAMDNGQLKNVMRTFGGNRCRHQWLVAGFKRGDKVTVFGT